MQEMLRARARWTKRRWQVRPVFVRQAEGFVMPKGCCEKKDQATLLEEILAAEKRNGDSLTLILGELRAIAALLVGILGAIPAPPEKGEG